MKIIEVKNLTKKFKYITAVNNISLTVKKGEIYGFVGLNGAGKTTTISMLLGLIKANNGQIKLFGKNIKDDFTLWNQIGYLVESSHSYPNLSVRENLNLIFKLRKLKNKIKIDEIIKDLKLEDYQNVKAKNLSSGNLQRLGLAKALIHRPELLILDEPVNSLDPAGIIEIRKMLKKLSEAGTTIFISSHILGELAKIATHITIIHQGKIIRELDSKELNNQLEKKLIIDTRNNSKAFKLLKSRNISVKLNSDNIIEINDIKAISEPENICKLLVNKEIAPRKLYTQVEDLETFFIRTIESEKV